MAFFFSTLFPQKLNGLYEPMQLPTYTEIPVGMTQHKHRDRYGQQGNLKIISPAPHRRIKNFSAILKIS
jgi:hypothetical protein